MQSLRKSLLQFVFSGSSMRRWNDKLRPVELYEVDKQAHKMITAFLLYQLQCRSLGEEERLALGRQVIEGGLFDYFYRLVITDIKPPIFYRIKENQEQYAQLTSWVLAELEPRVRPLNEGFWQRIVEYHARPVRETAEHPSTADRILRAAHLYASKWEFNLIRPLNYFDEELRDIDASFTEQLLAMRAMDDLEGVPRLLAGSGNALVRTANLCGQLRFQIRWSQTPRIPETSVLGHMFVVAAYAYFLSLMLDTCEARRLNNFFCGLFHDLPELLTRDIITPVKRSVEQLAAIIHQCEEEELQRRVLVPLAEAGSGIVWGIISVWMWGQSSRKPSVTRQGQRTRFPPLTSCIRTATPTAWIRRTAGWSRSATLWPPSLKRTVPFITEFPLRISMRPWRESARNTA